jgi:protein required for attachment to host cells
MTNTEWVVVVEKSGATVLRTLPADRGFASVRVFAHPMGRCFDRSFLSDRPGRNFNRQGACRHAYSPRVSPGEQDQRGFVKTLAKYLEHNRTVAFSSLVLIAPPHILGLMRKTLPKTLRHCVTKEIAKDYPSWLNANTLVEHLRKDLAPARD